METKIGLRRVMNQVGNFDLVRRLKTWTGRQAGAANARFSQMKLEYYWSRTDQAVCPGEDHFNTLHTKF